MIFDRNYKDRAGCLQWNVWLYLSLLAFASGQSAAANVWSEPPCYREIGQELVVNISKRLSQLPGAPTESAVRSRLENLDLLAQAGFQPLFFRMELIRFSSTNTANFRVEGRLRSADGAAILNSRFCAEARLSNEGACTVVRFQPISGFLSELDRERVESGELANCYSDQAMRRPTEEEMKQLYERGRQFFNQMDGKKRAMKQILFFLLLALPPLPTHAFWGIDNLSEAEAESCFSVLRSRVQPMLAARIASLVGIQDVDLLLREIKTGFVGGFDLISDYWPHREIRERRYVFSIYYIAGYHDASVGIALDHCAIVHPVSAEDCLVEEFQPIIQEPNREEWLRVRRDFRFHCYDADEQAEFDAKYLEAPALPQRRPI